MAEDAKIMASAGKKAILDNSDSRVYSSFLQWRFEVAPESGKRLEIKNANGNSFDPAIQFTTDGKNRCFAINVVKGTGYTVWLDDNLLMDEKKTTVFTETGNKLFTSEGMQFPADWSVYGETAHVGTDGIDVSVSGTTYTVKTPRGLAWIAWVTNNGKTTANTTTNITNTGDAYYPANAGFKDCTVKLANDISLATPTKGVAAGFVNNWVPIGTYGNRFQGTFDGNGKTITGMAIESTSVNYIGLFGYLDGATVQDLTMADEGTPPAINLKTSTSTDSGAGDNYYLGSVAGWVKSGKIINCHNKCAVSFSVSGKAGNVGGFAGLIDENSVLSACSNSGAITVSGSTVMGAGIVGVSVKSSIASCFNTGDVSAIGNTSTAYAGGIVGDSDPNGSSSNPSHISYCYSTGKITAKASSASTSGGIVGGAQHVVLKSCFATGTVSAESSSSSNAAYAGGIIGWIWDGKITVEDCLALNTEGVKAIGSVSEKHAGRIAGNNIGNDNGTVPLSNNYASTKIKLTVGNTTAAPTTDIAADAINGANTYLDDVATDIAGWTGEGKAFTAIGTTSSGKLPLLKVITNYDADGLPTTYEEGSFIPGQPDNLTSSTYLASLDPLSLSNGDTDLITLSRSDNKWSYTKGESGTPARFNGIIKMDASSVSSNKLMVATVTGNPTLTFEQVTINATGGAALTVNEGCELTIASNADSKLSASGASTLINKGTLRLSGDFRIENTGSSETDYCLDNSGTFSVLDPGKTPAIFHCAHTAIHNTGTLTNAWLECRFTAEAGQSGAKIAFAPLDGSSQSIDAMRYDKTLAAIVTAGKTYQLWAVATADARTRQKGSDSEGTVITRFPAPAADGAVAVFTDVNDLKTVEISGNQDFSAGCANEDVLVKSDGVLTVNAENAAVLNLTLEEGARVVTMTELKVSDTFATTRSLGNQWTAFGSPVALKASVGDAGILYAATGYTGTGAADPGWKDLSGTTADGTKAADLAADSPYLLAAETADTKVAFTATASAGSPIKIPATTPVTLGDALANGVFLFQANPNLADLTLSGIYVLNAEGTRFDLHESAYTLKPFEAYITANAVTRSRLRSVGAADGSVVTANEIVAATAALRVWATDGALHVYSGEAAALTVVRSDGRVVYAASIAPGDTRLALPSGIYMVRINNITYKIAL